MKFTPALRQQLRKALLAAFPIPGQINIVVGDAGTVDEYGSVVQFDRFRPPGEMLDAGVDKLLLWVNSNDYVVQFTTAAHKGAPSNPELRAALAAVAVLEDKYKALRPDADQPALGESERLVFTGFDFANVRVWLGDMLRSGRPCAGSSPRSKRRTPSPSMGTEPGS